MPDRAEGIAGSTCIPDSVLAAVDRLRSTLTHSPQLHVLGNLLERLLAERAALLRQNKSLLADLRAFRAGKVPLVEKGELVGLQ
jgi:hypothetical protein